MPTGLYFAEQMGFVEFCPFMEDFLVVFSGPGHSSLPLGFPETFLSVRTMDDGGRILSDVKELVAFALLCSNPAVSAES